MTEIRINISELKDEGSDVIKELTKYLEEKTKAKVEASADELTVGGEDLNISRTYLRVLLKKFLHKEDLKEYFRVIGGKDNVLVVKGRKTPEEE